MVRQRQNSEEDSLSPIRKDNQQNFNFWFELQFCHQPSVLLWVMKFASLGLQSHGKNKEFGPDDLTGTSLISYSIILGISFPFSSSSPIFILFMIASKNRKMSYSLPNYFLRISFTSEFPFPSEIRTFHLKYVFLSLNKNIYQLKETLHKQEKSKLRCKLSYFLGQLIFSTLSLVTFLFEFQEIVFSQPDFPLDKFYSEIITNDSLKRIKCKCSGLVHLEDPEQSGGEGGGRGDWDGEYL